MISCSHQQIAPTSSSLSLCVCVKQSSFQTDYLQNPQLCSAGIMDARFLNRTTFVSHLQHDPQEDSENSPENSSDSPRFSMLSEPKAVSTSAPRKSTKRSIPKRVVSVPIKDVEGSRLKGEMGTPPSDSWAWRKYGQKPIKGSPYPRGYYRCSSSKGCPARKQVERSRLDPDMLLITYAGEHNHLGPAGKNQNQHSQISPNSIRPAKMARRKARKPTASIDSEEEDLADEDDEEEEKPTKFASQAELMNKCHEEKLVANNADCSSLTMPTNDFSWFPEFECTTSSTLLESPILGDDRVTDDEMMRMAFTMQDDDESFFADLGVLPECTTVFRQPGKMERDEERRCIGLAPW